MLFLVTGENIDPGYLLPPEQTVPALEQALLPSFQQLAALEEEGTVRGGIFPGERAGAFVIEVDSFEALDGLMNGLPFFGLVRWQVKPLMPFRSVVQHLPQYIHAFRQQMQPGG